MFLSYNKCNTHYITIRPYQKCNLLHWSTQKNRDKVVDAIWHGWMMTSHNESVVHLLASVYAPPYYVKTTTTHAPWYESSAPKLRKGGANLLASTSLLPKNG